MSGRGIPLASMRSAEIAAGAKCRWRSERDLQTRMRAMNEVTCPFSLHRSLWGCAGRCCGVVPLHAARVMSGEAGPQQGTVGREGSREHRSRGGSEQASARAKAQCRGRLASKARKRSFFAGRPPFDTKEGTHRGIHAKHLRGFW